MICEECAIKLKKSQTFRLKNGQEEAVLCELCFDEQVCDLVKNNYFITIESDENRHFEVT